MNNSISLIKKDENIEKAITSFTWDRLDTVKDHQVEGVKEAQTDIDAAVENVIALLPKDSEKIKLIGAVLDACQYQSNLWVEKAYRMGMSDGLKLINSL
jgi:hypothetical protein